MQYRGLAYVLALMVLLTSCTSEDNSTEGYEAQFSAQATSEPRSWDAVTDKHRCYLKIQRQWRSAFRVNCFQIDGELHTHSNRFVEYNQWLSTALGRGDAWVYVVAQKPELLVAIDEKVYKMRAEMIEDASKREVILVNRGYEPAPEAIRVYRLVQL